MTQDSIISGQENVSVQITGDRNVVLIGRARLTLSRMLDLRERKEFTEGHIIDAINIPQASLDSRLNELEPYRESPVIVACKMGQQAGAAGNILRKAGFSNVMRLSGGMTGWRGDNLPVVKG